MRKDWARAENKARPRGENIPYAKNHDPRPQLREGGWFSQALS